MDTQVFRTSSDCEISKILLNDEEWPEFLRKLAINVPSNIDTKNKITTSDIDWVDTNRCVPVCDGSIVGKNNQVVSVVNGEIGEVFLRLWFGFNGLNTTLNRGLEIFPNGEISGILQEFWNWWQNFPPEPQVVGGILVSKPIREFGIGHLHAWIRMYMYKEVEEPKKARDRYLHSIRPWAYAYDLMHLFISSKLVKYEKGKMSVKNK